MFRCDSPNERNIYMEMDIDYHDTKDCNISIQPPDMPQNCRKRIQSIGGTNAVLFTHKRLCSADIGAQCQNFSIPDCLISYAFHNFLRDDEKMLLDSRDHYGFPNTINTLLLDISWDAWNVPLRKLVVTGYENVYDLGEPWLGVVRENELNEGDVVQLWAFRVGYDQQLWLALVKVEGVEHQELSLASLNIH